MFWHAQIKPELTGNTNPSNKERRKITNHPKLGEGTVEIPMPDTWKYGNITRRLSISGFRYAVYKMSKFSLIKGEKRHHVTQQKRQRG